MKSSPSHQAMTGYLFVEFLHVEQRYFQLLQTYPIELFDRFRVSKSGCTVDYAVQGENRRLFFPIWKEVNCDSKAHHILQCAWTDQSLISRFRPLAPNLPAFPSIYRTTPTYYSCHQTVHLSQAVVKGISITIIAFLSYLLLGAWYSTASRNPWSERSYT